jgi:hypothetical protein
MYQYTIYTRGGGHHNNFAQGAEYSGAGFAYTAETCRKETINRLNCGRKYTKEPDMSLAL